MLQLNLCKKEFTKQEWDKLITTYPNSTVYHTFDWLQFIKRSQKVNGPLIFEIRDGDKVVGHMPGFSIKKGPIKMFGSPFPGWTTPYMGPLFYSSISQDEMFVAIKKGLKKLGFLHFELTNQSLDIEIAMRHGLIIEKGNTYIAKIDNDSEKILAKFNQTTRNLTRRALKNRLIAEAPKNLDEFIDAYYQQLIQVFKKSNMVPTYSKNRVKLLIETMSPDTLLLTTVSYESKVIACMIDLIYGEWMHSFGTVSDLGFLKFYPNELARYHVMCQGAERGVRYYDMTGGGTYKRKFGSELVITNRIIYSRFGLYHLRNLAKWIVKVKNTFIAKWEKLEIGNN